MRPLATAWASSGGNVLGLAPSAAAAEYLPGRVALTEMFIEAQTVLALPGANDGNR
jgi:hypothetical protein